MKTDKRMFAGVRSLSLAGALFATGAAWSQGAVNGSFTDNFTTYGANACLTDGATFGAWTVAFAGYGCVSTGPDGSLAYAQTSPFASNSPAQTHAGLILGPKFSAPSAYSVTVKTTAQLRTGSAPNPWEVGWFLWDYADGSHFYYFQAKPNGWELGKEDPAYPGAQRFLATGSSPAIPVGAAYVLKVVQTSANSVTVYVNGQLVTSFTDEQTPYTSGQIGLYSEDATVRFENVSAAPTATAAPATPPVVAAPTVAALSPNSIAAGASAFNLAVDGKNFTNASVVEWNGKACPGTVQGTTRIVAYVAPSDVAAAGTATVTVATPGAASSGPLTFVVTPSGTTRRRS